MRIYKRQEFLKLPAGTVFCKGEGSGGCWEALSIKGCNPEDGWTNDFLYMDFDAPDNDGSEDHFTKLDLMLDQGKSFPMQTSSFGRDGCFDDDAVFLVYENADLADLISILTKGIT